MKERRLIGDKIKELRSLGYSYRMIMKELNCSPGSCTYHLVDGAKAKSLKLNQKSRKRENQLIKKVKNFLRKMRKSTRIPKKLSFRGTILRKVAQFNKGLNVENYSFLADDLLEKIGDNPVCYLTGRPIDLSDGKSYQLDHIIPRSKGGPSTLENCGLACKDANQSKRDMLLEDYVKLCKEILEHHGYTVTK